MTFSGFHYLINLVYAIIHRIYVSHIGLCGPEKYVVSLHILLYFMQAWQKRDSASKITLNMRYRENQTCAMHLRITTKELGLVNVLMHNFLLSF